MLTQLSHVMQLFLAHLNPCGAARFAHMLRSIPETASAQYARVAVQHWLDTERSYATEKLPDDWEVEHLDPGQVRRFVDQYLDRAVVFTFHTPQGRQALMKALMTLQRFAEATVRACGELPVAGVPSGEITMPTKRVP